ncbi:hypothetical protein BT96DRAFT_998793 [Gymnopus androsaceus JB14]|uniref:Uncharacterized protein n=1 Tax=Gymnopus androsaceus JB14 TaxID=1447944 RepID=A0A6A4H7G5_9AGAR|nr:hypothetical protein BT96DRAFT_998793 [Gymnopus androsaceus JB14]
MFVENTVSYDISCRSMGRYLDTDTVLYLEDCPVLTPSQCIYEGVSAGPYRDQLILQILHAGHRADVFDYVQAQRPNLWRRHQAAQHFGNQFLTTSFCIFTPQFSLLTFMAGYLDYWCSLDITGSAEHDSLTVQLETEFEDVERMVDCLIAEQQKCCLEIESELVPIKASIYSSLCHESASCGLILTDQLQAKLHGTAQEKAIVVREARERERARARTRARQCEHAAECELKGDKASRNGPHKWPQATYEADERRHLELRAQAEMYLLRQELGEFMQK